MLKYIVEIIRFRNENEYRENRESDNIRLYNSKKRASQYIRSYMKNHS